MQFYFVQKVFNKNLGERFAHMVISFGTETGLDPFTVTEIANRIADFIGQKFQTAFGVHIYTDNLHIHFIINSVSYVDGTDYKCNTTNVKQYYEIIKQTYAEMYDGGFIGYYTYNLY